MSGSKWQKKLVVQGLLALFVSTSSRVYADAPASKWYDTIAIGGYVQGSYVGNLNTPKTAAGAVTTNAGRAYDTDPNSFNMNSVLLQVSKPVGDSDHYGFTAKLRTGKDAQILNGLTTQAPATGSSTLYVEEAYVTYVVPVLTKLSLSAGKFLTPEGFEVADTVYNPNFSEGLLFWYAEPVTHTGIKGTYTFNDKVNTTFGVVNGWDVTSDNNDGKTLLWQIATAPAKGLTWSFQGLYGPELNAPTHSQRLSLDTVLGYTMGKLTLAAQGNWGQETNNPNTNHWVGAGVWASFATTSMFTESVRFEVLSDQNNANRFAAPVFADGTTNQTVKEVTLTHKTMLTSALGTRLEFRHDWSNNPYFTDHAGNGIRNQNTISMDWFVTF